MLEDKCFTRDWGCCRLQQPGCRGDSYTKQLTSSQPEHRLWLALLRATEPVLLCWQGSGTVRRVVCGWWAKQWNKIIKSKWNLLDLFHNDEILLTAAAGVEESFNDCNHSRSSHGTGEDILNSKQHVFVLFLFLFLDSVSIDIFQILFKVYYHFIKHDTLFVD